MSDLIHNEQTKLTATWANTIASGLVITGAVAPVVAAIYGIAGPAQAGAVTVGLGSGAFLAAGFALHGLARLFLRRLRP